MSQAYAYPRSAFETAEIVDLSDKQARDRLSRSALTAFFAIAEKWKLRDEDARNLLGGVSSSAYYEWKKVPARLLEVDRITRISYLIGIYKALHILYGEQLADEWIALPNRNLVFAGRTPLDFMQTGGLLAMQTVRKLLDARRGGL
jgi:uncharacterized protein (DUF2384 family)